MRHIWIVGNGIWAEDTYKFFVRAGIEPALVKNLPSTGIATSRLRQQAEVSKGFEGPARDNFVVMMEGGEVIGGISDATDEQLAELAHRILATPREHAATHIEREGGGGIPILGLS